MFTIHACNPDGGAFKYILTGIGNAFRQSGHQFSNIAGTTVPNNFDLYLGCSGWTQIIPHRRTRRGLVGIHVNPYGRKKVGGVDGGPIIDESSAAINWTLKQEPDFVYCYCAPTFIDDYYGYWTTKHGIPVVSMSTAADITIYFPRAQEPKFACDIGWVGGYWPYKGKMLDRYLRPLFPTYKCLIYGWGNSWGNGLSIADNDVPNLFSTAAICPSISESHSVVHPIDIPERVFKVAACRGFTIHTPSPAIPDLFGDVVPMAKDVNDWLRLIAYYKANTEERLILAKKQHELITDCHTYFDRIIGITDLLAKKHDTWKTASQEILTAKNKLLSTRS